MSIGLYEITYVHYFHLIAISNFQNEINFSLQIYKDAMKNL